MKKPLLQQYDECRPQYDRLSEAVSALSRQIVTSLGIDVVSIESRTKTRESFGNKISRPEKSEKYPDISAVTDLSGVRIIAFTQSDASAIVKEVRNHFQIDEENSVDKSEEQDADRFGYTSTHLIVSLTEERCKLLENRGLKELRAEIQIKTVLQHAWAALDWKLRYKSEIEVPKELRRKLYRVSALLEAADDIFSDLQKGVQIIRKVYSQQVSEKVFGIPVNRDSLEAYIRDSPSVDRVFDLIEGAGIPLLRDSGAQNDAPWSYLIKSLNACGISDLDQLSAALDKIESRHIKLLFKVWEEWGGGGRTFGIWSPLRILIIATLPKSARSPVLDHKIASGSLAAAERKVLLG